MALTTPTSVSYNYERDYDSLPEIVVPLVIKNSNFFQEDGQVLSAYACPIDNLYIYPNFLSATPIADDYRYFIDLGDGTISDDLTAQHFYSTPGDYKITLVACDSATNFYKSTDQPIIRVFNAVEDTLYMTYKEQSSAYQSTFENPIIITRFNSYQTYRTVSANGGYTINLNVSGNRSDFKTEEEYNKDPYIHLKTFSVFASATENGFIPITSLKTDNTFIYARRNRLTPSQGLEFFTTPRPGTIFIGSSGTAEVYYYED
tara:strand:- start:4479 stop:5258 length:780 start_codon:yes stop_codon:yes gene_type:complete